MHHVLRLRGAAQRCATGRPCISRWGVGTRGFRCCHGIMLLLLAAAHQYSCSGDDGDEQHCACYATSDGSDGDAGRAALVGAARAWWPWCRGWGWYWY